jgi:hypothetical protein
MLGYRPSDEKRAEMRDSVGYSFALGEGLTTARGALLAGGLQEHELRFVPSDSLSLNISRWQWEAGPRLGRWEPLARVGFTLLHLDIGHGVSFGMFSPRVGAGLWLKLPQSRIGFSAYVEYAWRWVGDESGFVRGVTLELQPRSKPLLPTRSTSWPTAKGPR